MIGRERPPLWVGVCVGLMVVALGVGCLLLFGNKTVHPTRNELTTGRAEQPQFVTPRAPTTPPKPRHAEPRFRCFDGTVVKARQICPVDSEAAQFYAFGIDRSACVARPSKGGAHNRWSYECRIRGAEVHLASYEPDERAQRLAKYAVQQDLGNGRIIAGGPKTAAGRWVRTYGGAAAAKGLLMYASVDADDPYNRQVLMSLAQRFAGYLLQGQPVAGAG